MSVRTQLGRWRGVALLRPVCARGGLGAPRMGVAVLQWVCGGRHICRHAYRHDWAAGWCGLDRRNRHLSTVSTRGESGWGDCRLPPRPHGKRAPLLLPPLLPAGATVATCRRRRHTVAPQPPLPLIGSSICSHGPHRIPKQYEDLTGISLEACGPTMQSAMAPVLALLLAVAAALCGPGGWRSCLRPACFSILCRLD